MRRDVDNRVQIKTLLENDFALYVESGYKPVYVIQVLQRKKDGCERDNYPVYQHTLDRADKIDKYFDIAVEYAEKYNARVYINVSPKDYYRVILRASQEYININLNNVENKSMESILYSAILKSGLSLKARHIFDVDVETYEDLNIFTEWADKFFMGDYWLLPTISGYHMIVNAGDYSKDEVIETFSKEMKDLITKIYMVNNHLDEKPNKHIKTMWSNLIHKESGNTLVYYKNSENK